MSTTNTKRVNKKNKIVIGMVNILLLIMIFWGLFWGLSTYYNIGEDLYTNDAQVEEFINPINTRISGYIKEVRFSEHQQVKKGDTLLLIDNSEYLIQLEQAEAAYLSAQAAKNVTSSTVTTVQSSLGVSDANIKAAQVRVWNAQQNYRRYEMLLKEGAATQQQFDQVKTEFDALAAQARAVEQQRNTTQLSTDETYKRIFVNQAEIKRAHAALAFAKLNLSYTVIKAPYEGVTGRRTIQEGQLVQPGQTLLSFVRTGSKWVVANYKETQISQLHIGQKMYMEVDGLEDSRIAGIVTAISQATGSKYSAIPVDNSTGNFIKVQQRIPVKIEFTNSGISSSELEQLRAGMNVVVRKAK
ncbi:EmrA Multidrug resistance efflux pump [Flavobacteriaceae bacterium]